MSEMSIRERYLSTMDFQLGVRPPMWEFAYWNVTVERWYGEGLPHSPWALPPGYPEGATLCAEGMPWPFPFNVIRFRDWDVNHYHGFDPGTARIPLNWRFSPAFDIQILEEDATTRTMINGDGALIRVKKSNDSLPQFLRGPIHDRASWEQVKAERFNTDNVLARFPDRWAASGPTYRNRDFPLGLQMDGFFSLPRELFLVEHQLLMYYQDPELMHDIARQTVKVWLAMLEELFSKTDLDFVYFWEDMSFKNGPLISPAMFREFITPYYQQVTGFLRERGVNVRCVDTDGDCWLLIPEFLEAGITGLYPFEVNAGMNIAEVRKAFPTLQIMGGLDKTRLAKGKEAIDVELETKLPYLLQHGGFIPHADHLVPPDVSWENFCHYRRRICDFIVQFG